MESSTIVAGAGVSVGLIGFLFGVYKHFATLKVSKLTYSISQISDFGVPKSFLDGMVNAPVAITVTSRGNKHADNIIGRIKTYNPIAEVKIDPSNIEISNNEHELQFQIDKLNPSQKILVSLKCIGEASVQQVESFELTHSSGEGLDENKITYVILSLLGVGMEFEISPLKTRLTRIGSIDL